MAKLRLLLTTLFLNALMSFSLPAASILRIIPEGEDVASERQIVFTFKQAVAPLGKPMTNPPITITPPLACQWRWLNTSTLACQLGDETALKLATRYQIQITPNADLPLDQPLIHTFTTQRPATTSEHWCQTWQAPGLPAIGITFNQPVTQASVAQHLYLQKPNGERIAVTAEPPPPTEEATQTTPPPSVLDHWLVIPQQPLPSDASIKLMVEPGLLSSFGPEPGVQKEVVLTFDTFPEFQFLGVQCTTIDEEEVTISPRAKWLERCNPVAGAYLLFSSPVMKKVVKDNLIITPDLAGGRTDYDPWEGLEDNSKLDRYYTKGTPYRIWLPEILKAYQVYHLKSSTQALQDEFGRSLKEPINLRFATDHRAPEYVFEHPFAVLEKAVDSEVPLYVTNLENISVFYNVLTAQGWSEPQEKSMSIPKVRDVSFKIPLKIRELLPTSGGAVQGYFLTSPNLHKAAEENWFFSQVTPFHLQVKLGHHNTLVWVTDFATGLPVKGVNVDIYSDDYAPKTTLPASLASATTDANGLAQLPGTATLDPDLEISQNYSKDKPRLWVRGQQGEDLALLPLDYEFRVQTHDDFYPNPRPQYGHIHTWGTTAQGLYKVGDTIQYKIFVRDQNNQAFTLPPKEFYTLKVIDPKDQVVHEVKNLRLSDFGTLAGEFTVPKNAAVGWYQFKLQGKFPNDSETDNNPRTWSPMQVLVSDFTPASFRVQTVLNGQLFHLGDATQVNTSATLHAGGPYGNAQAKITATLTQTDFHPTHPQTQGFYFNTYVEDTSSEETIYTFEGSVDQQGQLQTLFTLPKESKVLYGELTVESSVRDDRGKDIANRATARYVGRDRLVGLKETSWLLTAGQAAKVLIVVTDEFGNPVTNTPIHTQIEREEIKAARVKGPGNAYLTQYNYVWVATDHCEAISQTTPVTCTFTPPQAGEYKITATVTDHHGRSHSSELWQWATGEGSVVWETSPDNNLEIKAEKASYQVGETARYVVKNPYPGARALITVERFGTIKNWVTTFKDSIEVVEIPVEPDYVPGFFVSVSVMSPRVEKPLDRDQVDLGKPAFRMGYAKTMVSDPYKELVIDIHSDQPEYRPRQPVTVNLQVKTRQPEVQPQPLELAVTVLDEAVFDLISQGRDYFDPYKGFYSLDDLDVVNFDLLMRLVGRQKFEKKGASAGGDGGLGPEMRSLFKYVSYWNPALPTDAKGQAQIQFTAPDNLTGWRVLALAVTPTDRMGLGEGTFKVNQPIEIRQALPNQLLSGDTLQAGFTVMNRTEKARELKIDLTATGPVTLLETAQTQQLLKTAPFKRYPIWLPLKATAEGTIEFKVLANDGEVQDGLSTTLPVHKPRSLDTVATYGTTVQNQVMEAVEFPKEIYPDAGGLTVLASPTVIGGIEGAFEYMRDYPYACWEQKLSKGVMAAHYQSLQAYLPATLSWPESQTLATETLKLATEFQAPNGGMSLWRPEDDHVNPYLSAYTALAFNWLRDRHYPVPDAVENKLHEYLLSLLRRDVMPDFYSKGMASSVRAVALAALAKSGKIARADLKRYQLQVKNMDLFGKTMFLAAALQVPNTESLRTEVVKTILSHSDQTAGRISFQEKLTDEYSHLFSSSLRTQCAILSTLVEYDKVAKDDLVSDIPVKLIRNITQLRKNQGHWENTQENLFCMNALIEFAKVYERTVPAMTVRAWLDTDKLGEGGFNDVKNPPLSFHHALTAHDPGRQAQVKLEREGQGRVYYSVRLAYAPKAEVMQPVNAGIEVNREYQVKREGQWVLLKSPMSIKTGELIRIDLYVSLPAPRYFVVVDDPVPGGLEPVNRDLGTASQADAKEAQGEYAGGAFWFSHDDWQEYETEFWSFYHKELRHDAARFYADYLPAGNYHLAYVAQAIAPGEFRVMPTHTEEMYEPEVYGKSAAAILKVTRE